MKGIVTVIWKKLIGLFLGLIGIFKRLICRIRRSRKNSGSLLPMTNKVTIAPEVNQSVPSNEIELESWDTWEGEDSKQIRDNEEQQFQINQSNVPAYITTASNHHHPAPPQANHVLKHSNSVEPEPEPDINFFEDMTPKYQRQKKIIIKKKEKDIIPSSGFSSRLAFNNDVPIQDGLETWDENNAWEADADEDLTWEAEAAIKDKKRQDRMIRQNEQKRKRQEKEMQRMAKRESGHTLAAKLS